MDTKKLEALAAAVQYGSFTRAAEALGYTGQAAEGKKNIAPEGHGGGQA